MSLAPQSWSIAIPGSCQLSRFETIAFIRDIQLIVILRITSIDVIKITATEIILSVPESFRALGVIFIKHDRYVEREAARFAIEPEGIIYVIDSTMHRSFFSVLIRSSDVTHFSDGWSSRTSFSVIDGYKYMIIFLDVRKQQRTSGRNNIFFVGVVAHKLVINCSFQMHSILNLRREDAPTYWLSRPLLGSTRAIPLDTGVPLRALILSVFFPLLWQVNVILSYLPFLTNCENVSFVSW